MTAGPEKLLLIVFGFLERWQGARTGSLWSSIDMKVDDRGDLVATYKSWNDAPCVPLGDIASIMNLLRDRPPRQPQYLYPAGWVITPIGPMPFGLYSRIVLRMRDEDALEDRRAWMRALKRGECSSGSLAWHVDRDRIVLLRLDASLSPA